MLRTGRKLELPAQQVFLVVVEGAEREVGFFNHRPKKAKDNGGISGVCVLNVGPPLSGELHINLP